MTTGSVPIGDGGGGPRPVRPAAGPRAPAAGGPAPVRPSAQQEYGNIMRAAALPIRLNTETADLSAVIEEEDKKNGTAAGAGQLLGRFNSRSKTLSRRQASTASSAAEDKTGEPGADGERKWHPLRFGSAATDASSPSGISPTTSASSPNSSMSSSVSNSTEITSPPPEFKRSATGTIHWDHSVETAHRRAGLKPRSARMEMDMRRQPPLRLVPYRKMWAMDPLALPHNAIRKELLDCYVILYAMDVRREELNAKDYEMFFGWWRVFSTFLLHYLKAEEEVLYPWIENAVRLQGLLAADKREKIKEHLRHVVVLIAKSETRFNTTSFEYEPLYVLKRAVDKVALLSQEYFGYEERTLPRYVMSVYTEADKRELDKNMVNFYLKGSSPASDIVILTRWLQPDERDPKKLLEWRYDNLKPVIYAKYGMWWKKVNGKHLSVPVYFKAKRDFYKAEMQQRNILLRENPDLYRRKYGRVHAERERFIREHMTAEQQRLLVGDEGVVSSGRDEELEAQLKGDAMSAQSFPPRSYTTGSVQAASDQVLHGNARAGAPTSPPRPASKSISPTSAAATASTSPPTVTSPTGSTGGVSTVSKDFATTRGKFESGDSFKSSVTATKSFKMSREGQAELDELVSRAAKLNEYLRSLDRKYGAGLDPSYGTGENDDAMSMRSGSQYAESVGLGDEFSLADDPEYQRELMHADMASAYSMSLKGDDYDSKSMMTDIDIDLDSLSLADGEEYDMGKLDLEEYLEFDDALSCSGMAR